MSGIIKFEDINNSGRGPLFLGDRPRLSCVTSVQFLDAQRLVACNLVGQRMYLVRFDLAAGTHHVESCIPTQFEGREVRTDLMDFDGRETIVTSNCHGKSVSLYRVKDRQISYIKGIPIQADDVGFCHGVRFVPPRGDVVCATCTAGGKKVYFISVETHQILYQFSHEDWLPKDVCFLDERRMIVLFARDTPKEKIVKAYESKAVLINLDLARSFHEIVGEIVWPDCHVDACGSAGGKLYVNDQMADTVIECSVSGNDISFERTISGYNFPHGIDVLPELNLLAVTNYGDNTIVLTKL